MNLLASSHLEVVDGVPKDLVHKLLLRTELVVVNWPAVLLLVHGPDIVCVRPDVAQGGL